MPTVLLYSCVQLTVKLVRKGPAICFPLFRVVSMQWGGRPCLGCSWPAGPGSRAKLRPKTGIDGQIHREIVERWHLGTLRNTLNTAQLRGRYCEWQLVSGEGKFWINQAHRLRPSRGEKQAVVLVGAYKPDWSVVRPKWEGPCFQKHLSTNFLSPCLWSLLSAKTPSLCRNRRVCKHVSKLKQKSLQASKLCWFATSEWLNGGVKNWH